LNLSGRYPRIATPFTKAHARLFAKTSGGFLGRWMGSPVLVIEVVGRKSGKLRRVPIIYMPDGDRIVVVAANGGNDRTPAWWLNLRETGEADIVIGAERRHVSARVAEGDEREDLWERFAKVYPGIDEYKTFTDRTLPVIVLESRP
jgi:deazaflavin-dependent oxidoreductase (nitroreductase family)